MKRFLVIPIMVLYMLAVSGLLISAHYCGSELESWEVYQEVTGCAGGECGDESEEADGCCEDKVIAAKVSVDQKLTEAFKLKLSQGYEASLLPVLVYGVSQESWSANESVSISYQPNAPPGPWQQIPLYKLHSRFTYYG